MRILILGAGAVGLYFGGILAMAGHQVQFGARRQTSETLSANGLKLVGPRGTLEVKNISATHLPGQAKNADVVLFCVKLYDVASAALEWREALESAGTVICLQNGIDALARLGEGAPHARGVGGLAFVAGRLEAAGVMHYLSDMSSITFGGPGASSHAVLQALARAINNAQTSLPVSAALVEDIALAQWTKFLALATNAALTCITNSPAGVVYHDEDLLGLARQSVGEILAVGRAEGVALQDSHAATALAMLQGLPAGMVASMHHDLAAGKPLELEGLSGLVVRLGKKHSLATPFHHFVYTCLKPRMRGTNR